MAVLRLRQGRAGPGAAVLAALAPGTCRPAGARRPAAAARRGRTGFARRRGVRAARRTGPGPPRWALAALKSPCPRPRGSGRRRRAGRGLPAREVRDDDPLLMIFTSGTEGASKAAVLTHANCFWTNLSLSRTLDLGSTDVVLAVLPQFHVGGWNIQPLLAWWTGATVVLERGFEPGRVLQLIAERGVTMLMGVPTQYLMLAEHPDFAAARARQPAARRGGRGADAGAAAADLAPQGSGPEPGLRADRGVPNVLCLRQRGRRADGRLLGQAVPACRRRGGRSGHRRDPRRRRRPASCWWAVRGSSPATSATPPPRPPSWPAAGCAPATWWSATPRVHQGGGPAQGHLHFRRRERGPGRG